MSNEKRSEPLKLFSPMGRRVQDLRKAKGWSQEKLAEVSDLTRYTIMHVEHGHHTPRPVTVALLAAALGVDPYYLVTGVSTP